MCDQFAIGFGFEADWLSRWTDASSTEKAILKNNFHASIENLNTTKSLLHGHPWGNGKWPLKLDRKSKD